jgi:hypothetical protein
MDIPENESQIISVLFHPRIVRCVKRRVGVCGTFMEQIGKTPSHESVKFANTLPVGDGADHIQSHLARWLRKKRMHVVCSNFGVVDEKDSQILGSDMLLAYEPTFRQSSECDPILTMCTLLLHPTATPQEISSAYGHAKRLHHMLCVSYNIRCRSVVLTWGLNGKLSESWL